MRNRGNGCCRVTAAQLACGLLLGGLVVVGGCKSGGSEGGSSAGVTAMAKQQAAEIFKTRCTPCHGSIGQGDGPASATLNPKPRKFGDKSWQKSVTDSHIEKIIVYGGAAVQKSPAMPANPDLNGKEDVVTALRMKVRSFGK